MVLGACDYDWAMFSASLGRHNACVTFWVCMNLDKVEVGFQLCWLLNKSWWSKTESMYTWNSDWDSNEIYAELPWIARSGTFVDGHRVASGHSLG